MTDEKLERRLRDWYRSEIPADASAPPGLRSRVTTIPQASTASSGRFATRRGFALPSAAWRWWALLAGTAMVGGFPPRDTAPPVSRIVFVRDGDLFIGEVDRIGPDPHRHGRLQTTASLATSRRPGRPTGATSLPSATSAAHSGRLVFDLMNADGALVRTVALDAGCGPSLSWSPDIFEVAIATCPADIRRDAIEAVESGIGLLIAGLDASADREIALPPEWQSVASANPEVWIRPDLWARWSPDGRWISLWAIVAGQEGTVCRSRRWVGHPPDRRARRKPIPRRSL